MRFLTAAALVCLAYDVCRAQLDDPIHKAVTWKHRIVPAGNLHELRFEAEIKPGYVVYSVVPPEGQGNLPTTVEFPKTKGFQPVGPLREEGEPKVKYDEIFETNLRYFERRAVFVQSVKRTGKEPIVAVLKHQVCDSDGRCVLMTPEFKFD
ncbi:MAG: protein-disulfide reductase DsbD family protein [Bacteroidia bacterium]|nr:protein-disulfide reductase DsbD N-terminal domain-containing protein [Bacteroidia bacterium]MDW8332883.1 protein-disulfide reductase DsbD family protein [Bacteroidia bacterium]